jgi:hypothetical protein
VTKLVLAENERRKMVGGSAFEKCGRDWDWKIQQPGQPVPSPSMVLVSMRLDARAGAAIAKAIRLDEQEAPPQRETERQTKQADENRAAQEKARPVKKANLRP